MATSSANHYGSNNHGPSRRAPPTFSSAEYPRSSFPELITNEASGALLSPSYSKPDIEEKISSPPLTPHAEKPSYHPLSVGLFAFWVVFILVELALLERSVALAPTTVRLPWVYRTNGFPAVLNTIFAQGHGPITAMHLSRPFVSGLDFSHGAPRRWIEVFWTANDKWSSPLGILTTIMSMYKLRIRVSPLFALFALVSIVTLVTPIVLDQAYPVVTLDVQLHQTFNPSTFSSDRLDALDAYAQMAAGKGTWTTNQTVLNVFNSTTFTPTNGPRSDVGDDFFFAGDVQGMDVSDLPGVRIQGGCHAVASNVLLDLNNYTTFTDYCNEQLELSVGNTFMENKILAGSSLALNVSLCINATCGSLAAPYASSGYVHFASSSSMLAGDPVDSLVRCDTSTIMGTASIDGRSLAFSSFQQDDGLYNTSLVQAGEPIENPLFAVFYAMMDDAEGSDIVGAQVINSLGFAEVTDAEHGLLYTPPSTDELANAMWRGATHMAVALTLLSRDSTTSYPAIDHVPVSGRVRRTSAFIGAIFLLGIWFLTLSLLTVLMWRKTALGDSFDSYVAVRLIINRPDLVDGDSSGGLERNERLLEPFERR